VSHKIVIKIKDFSVLEGSFPPRALGLVMEWAAFHKHELMRNWDLVKTGRPLEKIAPLE